MKIAENNQTRRSGWVSALAGLGLLLAAAAPALAGNGNVGNPQVLPPQSHPFGASYAEWAARYWKWQLAFPTTADPAADTAPPDSAQSGKVWFLATVSGNRTVTRQITVPASKALFFPALSVFVNNAACPVPTTFTIEELLAQANDQWDRFASITAVTIDGVPIAGLDNPQTTPYRLQTDGFIVTVAAHDNQLAGDCVPDGGTVGTVAVGAFLMVKPLSVGTHTIRIVGAAGPLANPFFVKDVTYEITVAP